MAETTESPEKQALRADELFRRGNDAALKSNNDYAIQMYREACRLVPDNLVYRQSLRGVTRRKFHNDPSKVGMMAGARVQPIRLRARTEKAKSHWDRVIDVCEDVFQLNPWDVGASRDSAEAALHLGYKDMACWLIDSVFSQGEGDKDFLRVAAQTYEANRQYQKAIGCWDRVYKLNPYDEQAKRQINALSASATIMRSGLQDAVNKSTYEQARPDPKVAELDELKQVVETQEHRWKREILEDPTRIGPYLDLSEYYRSQNKLDDAEKTLAAGRKAIPDDEVIRTAYSDVQMLRLRRAIAHWNKKAELEPDSADVRQKLEALQEKLNAYELNERRHRVKAQPTDAQAKLDFGACLARQGKHDEAIAEFQQVRSLGKPSEKMDALCQAGRSFEIKGLRKLAERSYQDALKLLDPDDIAMFNELHFRLGCVAEAEGNLSVAEEHFNEVAANDYTYLDVAERLRALNERRS